MTEKKDNFVFTKDLLDYRICDCEDVADNVETYREYIHNTLDAFHIKAPDLDSLSGGQLGNCLDFCNDLWLS